MAPSKSTTARARPKNPFKRKLMVRRGREVYDSKLFCNAECHDRYVKYYLEGKMLDPYAVDPSKIDELGFGELVGLMNIQQVGELMVNDAPAYLHESCQFYANLTEIDGSLYKMMVNGQEFQVSRWILNELVGCSYKNAEDIENSSDDAPLNVYNANGWLGPGFTLPGGVDRQACASAYFGRPVGDKEAAHVYNLKCMTPAHRVLYDFVHRILVPSAKNVSEPTSTTAILFYYVVLGRKINPGHTIMKHMVNQMGITKQYWNIPYGGLITKLLLKSKPGFVFQSTPVPARMYGLKYFQNRGYDFVDGVWSTKVCQVKSKRAKGNAVMIDAELYSMAERMYGNAKDKTSHIMGTRQKVFQAKKKFSAMERSLSSRGFDLDFP